MLGGPLLPHRPLQSRIHAVLLPHPHTHSGWLSVHITSTLVTSSTIITLLSPVDVHLILAES